MSFAALLNGIENMYGTYEQRKVAKDETPCGLVVSTANTELGLETAIGDCEGFHPVERYTDKEAAVAGHKKWVEYATQYSGQKLTKLGWPGLVADEEITLKTS